MLAQLRKIVEQVSKVDDVYEALSTFVKQTCSAMGTDCCTVYLANEEHQRLELMATQGLKFKGDKIHIGFDEGLVGFVKRTAEPLNVAEAYKHPHFKYFKQLGEEVYNAFLATPIIHRKQVLGILVVQQKTPRLFSEMEVSFLVTLAAQLAVIVTHAQTQGQWLLSKQRTVNGIPASSGVAIGEFWFDNTQPRLADVCPASSVNIDREQEWLSLAIERALADFRKMRKKLDSEIHKDALAIFDLFTHLLNDPILRKDFNDHIQQGERADWALRQVIDAYSSRFARMSDGYLKERAQDVRELGQRLLYFLYNTEKQQQHLEKPIILVVRELSASLLATLPKDKLLAVISLEGAANSHAAILSRALGVPAIVGVKINLNDINGRRGIVDGYSGRLFISPNRQLLREYKTLANEERALTKVVNDRIFEPALTLDGQRIELMLNAVLSGESHLVPNQAVDGIGLYRTEISFLMQHRFPSEEEQVALYRSVLTAYDDKPVVMRTLDVGGDKPLPYLPIEEDNPFLGWRGIRFTLDHPDIFLIQLRSMLKASVDTQNLSIMLPMISSVSELDDALFLLNQAFNDVKVSFPSITWPKIGIMLEVPSMLYLLPDLADKIDFVSVGTNDLTQYLLAVDRNNTRVADVYDSMHPAVIRALNQIQTLCQQYQIPVCICGELAGHPMGALLLTGLGFTSLSMNPSNIARVKYLLRNSSFEELKKLAQSSLLQSYGNDIYIMMRTYFEENGFAGFIRAGNK
ncbi:MAG: phosphoenolpyruvate--protein phosphotransferase [Vibrio sp.]